MKTTKEKIEIMQAYERGEQIEFSFADQVWKICDCEPSWDWITCDYRVKPKIKYVPFENVEEFIDAQKEHGVEVKYLQTNAVRSVFINSKGEILMRENNSFYIMSHVREMYGLFKFLDNTPCGKQMLT